MSKKKSKRRHKFRRHNYYLPFPFGPGRASSTCHGRRPQLDSCALSLVWFGFWGVPAYLGMPRRGVCLLYWPAKMGPPWSSYGCAWAAHGLATTERYLGTTLDLENAPCDNLGLAL